jgi:ubiquitin C-terminal hydrolase
LMNIIMIQIRIIDHLQEMLRKKAFLTNINTES